MLLTCSDDILGSKILCWSYFQKVESVICHTGAMTDSYTFSSKHWIHLRCAVPRHNPRKVLILQLQISNRDGDKEGKTANCSFKQILK